MLRKRVLFSFTLLGLSLAVSGCVTNQATGKTQLATLMSSEDEAAVGANAHPKIVAAYGGVYGDQTVGLYVAGVTRRITAATQMPTQPYRVTVLNSPVVNAFALPGGYVYVTRGLLSLVNDEAELAGVLGHEIGHVIARHGAQRQTAALGTSVLGAVLGAVVGNGAVNQAVGLGSQGLLAGYSRDQEYEADTLGVHYLAGAGYDPYAQGDFLTTMDQNSRLEAMLAGASGGGKADWLASHPATPERVAAARREAAASQMPGDQGERNQAALFRAINGMVYGDSPEQGIVRDRTFIHPVGRFRFDVPAGFRLTNGAAAVLASGPQKSLAKFDSAKKAANVSIGKYLANVWAVGVALSPVEIFSVNGLKAARATTIIGAFNATLVAIEAPDGTVYRFLMGEQRQTSPRYQADLDRIAASFRLISRAEANAVKPMRVKIVKVRAGDTVASLSSRMPFADYKVERFRALNGMPASAALKVGQSVKIIAE
ncbi:MAG: M48 family metalloprotease [Parvibaculum sp.]|nr:M48 family metalloprotease [Parvibaculum sp.]